MTHLRNIALWAIVVIASLFAGVPSGAFAQGSGWQGVALTDGVRRPDTFCLTVANTDATTATLFASTSDIIVDNYDIYTSTPTSVPTASIHDEYLHAPKRLAVYIKDNSGSGLAGYISIRGKNQFNQGCTDNITVAGAAKSFALTSHAFTVITSIDLSHLSGQASGDRLGIGVWGFGLQNNGSAILSQFKETLTAATTGQTTATLTTALTYTTTDLTTATGVWNANYRTWYYTSGLTVGDQYCWMWSSDYQQDMNSGPVAIQALQGNYATGLNNTGFGYTN